MRRRDFLQTATLAAAGAALSRNAAGAEVELDEVTIAGLQEAMGKGAMTAHALTAAYLDRIEKIDRRGPALHAVIETNPDALAIADALDLERKQKGARGPLHGIPVLIKDNIDTADKMMTTAGSLALAGAPATSDSTVAKRLRDAGAVILGKTNLSEWANLRSSHSTSGWSARGGQTKNPYALDRNPCGSSSGSGAAVAAQLSPLAVGTRTARSVGCPATTNWVISLKTTAGRMRPAGGGPVDRNQEH